MQGFTVNIESGAGVLSQFRDEDFAASGAKIVNKTDAFKQVHTTYGIYQSNLERKYQ